MATQPAKAELESFRRLLELARAEDLGGGDITAAMLVAGATARGRFVARQELVFCGGPLLEPIAAAYDGGIVTKLLADDGRRVAAGDVLAEWSGPAGAILSAERVALNFLQRLSGVATATAAYVAAVAGTKAKIYDTRKTTPGWRLLEKYAVRVGGGSNHRMGLYDAVLIKDNHLAIMAGAKEPDAIAALAGQIDKVRSRLPAGGFVELEVDSLEQLPAALKLNVDVVMLDNMSAAELAEAAGIRDGAAKRDIKLEASGGITLANVRAVAEAGVDRIAIGALTHSAAAADIALDMTGN